MRTTAKNTMMGIGAAAAAGTAATAAAPPSTANRYAFSGFIAPPASPRIATHGSGRVFMYAAAATGSTHQMLLHRVFSVAAG